jgi:exodeoxyribonuclease VIII
METGWISGISNENYHAGEGINRSTLWKLLYWSPKQALIRKEPTDPMKMGTDLHCSILEPERFEKEYRVIPSECRKGSGKGQVLRRAEFEAKAKRNGWTIIKAEDMEKVKRMRDAILTDPDASVLLKDGISEICGYWYDPDEKDILCKIRLDYLQTETGIIVDLKKTTDAREKHFTDHAHAMGYLMQAWWSLYGATQITRVAHNDFRFIVVEDHDPWEVVVYQASPDFIHIGGLDCGRALKRYIECYRSGGWPGYGGGVRPLNPPPWRMRKEMLNPIIE